MTVPPTPLAPPADGDLAAARAVWRDASDPVQRLQAGWRLCAHSFQAGDLADAIHLGEACRGLSLRGASPTQRFDLLALLVVAYGELARHDEAVQAVRQLLCLSTRRGRLADYTRSRSSLAACLALMGDPWAAQRVLGTVADRLQLMPGQGRLEAKARVNLAWISLQAARVARDAADPVQTERLLDHAREQLARSAQIAAQQGHARLAMFSQMHQCEYELLSGRPADAMVSVRQALAQAGDHRMQAHQRRLQLMHAELLLVTGQSAAALARLEPLLQRLGPGHDLGMRIQTLDLAARACIAAGETPRGVVCLERQRALEMYRSARQLQALAQHAQARLDLEDWSARSVPDPEELAA